MARDGAGHGPIPPNPNKKPVLDVEAGAFRCCSFVAYQATGATPRPASRTVIVRVMMVVMMVALPGNMI